MPSTCDTVCVFKRQSATCKMRIQYAAEHKFSGKSNGCQLAHNLVLQDCLNCSGCTPDAASCAPYNCQAGYSNWELNWSYQKKIWCCKHEGHACPRTTTTPYDCSTGYSNWEKGWTLGKKAWCCVYAKRGCPKTTLSPYNKSHR